MTAPGIDGAAILRQTVSGDCPEIIAARSDALCSIADYVAGRIPLAKLVRSVGGSSPFFKTVVGQFVLESANDQIARHWQDFNSWMVLHPEKTFDDYLTERPNAAFEAFIASATASFMQTTGAYAIDGGIAKAKAGAASIRAWLDVAQRQGTEQRSYASRSHLARGQFTERSRLRRHGLA